MNPFRARGARSIIVAGLGLFAAIAAERPLQARQAEPLLQPTPLVLKDGRIASVSIHVVPFAPGRAELGGEAAARVAELTRAVGTDCFLTAQVIGHIDSSEVAQDDTLNAHRLARSRADAVQASLIGGGLPAKAIASVWDWQFMVRAPRATLWIFQLIAGEDCEGRPLGGDLVAQAAPSSSRAAAQPERAATPAPAGRTANTAAPAPVAQVEGVTRPAAPAAARAQAEASQNSAQTPSLTQARPTPEPKRAAPAGPAEQREAGTTVAARPALAPKAATGDKPVEQPQRGTGTTVAAKPAPAVKAAASGSQGEQPATQGEIGTAIAAKPAPATAASASDGKVERGSEGSLVITFATNSSYFPSGAARRLRELLAGIDPENKYQVTLRVAVSGTTKVVGARSPQEAASYNKWLAERRLERVQNWLVENAAVDALSFKPEYVTDESRQVVVRLAPLG
ncbi:MAG TPA: hypothetical protein VFZ10_03625 [Geminicoccaceae bacterium]